MDTGQREGIFDVTLQPRDMKEGEDCCAELDNPEGKEGRTPQDSLRGPALLVFPYDHDFAGIDKQTKRSVNNVY